jgi:hypothetical protein
MKKIIILLAIASLLLSCKKETVQDENMNSNVWIRFQTGVDKVHIVNGKLDTIIDGYGDVTAGYYVYYQFNLDKSTNINCTIYQLYDAHLNQIIVDGIETYFSFNNSANSHIRRDTTILTNKNFGY